MTDRVFQVPMAGFEAVAARCADTDWTLALGQVSGGGVTLRRLQRRGLQSVWKTATSTFTMTGT